MLMLYVVWQTLVYSDFMLQLRDGFIRERCKIKFGRLHFHVQDPPLTAGRLNPRQSDPSYPPPVVGTLHKVSSQHTQETPAEIP